jgi:hypothetical protein
MMKKIFFLFSLILSSLFAVAQPPAGDATKGTVYGEKMPGGSVVTVQQLHNLMNAKSSARQIRTKISGVVAEVCKKEGCWIKIQSPDGTTMVKMKDHSFKVPLSLNGKNVIIDGIVEIKETPVSELKHLAEDAGKSKAEIDAIKQAKREIVVEAKSVQVVG